MNALDRFFAWLCRSLALVGHPGSLRNVRPRVDGRLLPPVGPKHDVSRTPNPLPIPNRASVEPPEDESLADWVVTK
jgi:hypothetical protein